MEGRAARIGARAPSRQALERGGRLGRWVGSFASPVLRARPRQSTALCDAFRLNSAQFGSIRRRKATEGEQRQFRLRPGVPRRVPRRVPGSCAVAKPVPDAVNEPAVGGRASNIHGDMIVDAWGGGKSCSPCRRDRRPPGRSTPAGQQGETGGLIAGPPGPGLDVLFFVFLQRRLTFSRRRRGRTMGGRRPEAVGGCGKARVGEGRGVDGPRARHAAAVSYVLRR